MQFNTSNLTQPQLYTKKFSNFRGLDYTNAKLDIADNRSPDMQNFIFKDGINQKRNGYSQILKIEPEGNLNGFWEFQSSDKKIHRIAQVGTKFYRVNYSTEFGKDPYTNSYEEISLDIYTPLFVPKEQWSEYLKGVKDQRSFGVVRGDRLYIFCGITLVYGSWDGGNYYHIRAVRENEDTYIPTTTTNITHSGYEGQSTRASLEEVNMMTSFRKNKMFGAQSGFIEFGDYNPNNWGQEFLNTWNKGYIYDGAPVKNIQSVYFILSGEIDGGTIYSPLEVPLINDGKTHVLNWDNFVTEDGIQTNTEFKDICPALSISYVYTNTHLVIRALFGFVSEEIRELAVITAGNITQNFSYQLDATGISMTYFPVLKINSDYEEITYEDWQESNVSGLWNPIVYREGSGKDVFNDITLDTINGILEIGRNCNNSVDPNPNIEIKFATLSAIENESYKKIDGCTTGIIFGYNGIEHLFVSGNPDFPNMDWHTSESLLVSDNNTVPNSQNLTYFGELSYAYLGNSQTKVKSYLLLNDSTLGILKEFSPTESSLYIREPYLSDVVDPSGNIVYDFSGNAYQKVYYKQYMSAIGEGCVSSFASSNLAGDKLFLSENGVYGIQLDLSNYISNQRYAKEKSRLINPVLEKYGKKILENAIAISYQNRYYLSIDDAEGTIYIADARFRNSDASEMNDTMGYEWWCWKGVNAHIWFIDLEGNLGFGTKDGKLCVFNNEKSYQDTEILKIDELSLSYDAINKNFVFDENYDISNATKIKFITDLEEKIFEYNDVESIDEDGNIKLKEFEKFVDYVEYLEDKEVNLYIDPENPNSKTVCLLKEIDYDNKTFKLFINETQSFVSRFIGDEVITRTLNEETAIDVNYEEKTFDLESFNSENKVDIFGSVGNLDDDLKAYIVKEKPVIAYWYTPFINFENSDFSKTLKYVTIVPEKVEHGKAEINIFSRTKASGFTATIEGIDANTLLDNLNFSSFSIEIKDFAQSFSKKIRIRNFNFLVILMESKDNKNFAVQELTLTYLISKRNKGVK